MPASAIDKEFMKYFTRLDEPQKKSLLAVMKTLLKPGNRADKGASSIEAYNQQISEAMEDWEKGNTLAHEDVVKLSKGW